VFRHAISYNSLHFLLLAHLHAMFAIGPGLYSHDPDSKGCNSSNNNISVSKTVGFKGSCCHLPQNTAANPAPSTEAGK